MHQFELKNFINIEFFGYNFSITNGTLVLCFTLFLSLLFAFLLGRWNKLVPNRRQSALELSLGTIRNIVSAGLGEEGRKFVPFVFSIFLFILLLNVIGLVPATFAQTSHISITFTLAIVLFFVCVFVTIAKRGIFGFIKSFIPAGTPWWLAPLLFVLELFSYLVRPVSLSVRLAANMIAGHVMLDVIAFFVVMMGVFGIVPFSFLSVLMVFELFVAFLQAYIFSIFSCVYLNEACGKGH